MSGSNSSATGCSAWSSPTGSTSCFPDEPEGKLSQPAQRAGRARDLRRGRRASSASPRRMRLGKQARDDGAFDSDNVLGDVVEALIGALYLDAGLEAADALRPPRLGDRVEQRRPGAQASQVGAAGMGRGARPQAAGLSSWSAAPARTTRRASSSRSRSRASARRAPKGSTKQEAETAAAAALLEQLE